MNFKFFMSLDELDNLLFEKLKEVKGDYLDLKYWEDVIKTSSEFFKNKFNLDYLDSGRNRVVLTSSNRNVVVKIPKSEQGNQDNKYENENQSYDTAKCKLFKLPKSYIFILVMEKLEKVTSDDLKNRDVRNLAYQFDSGQIGKSKRGIFKGYDFGQF